MDTEHEPARRVVVTGPAAAATVIGFDPLTRTWVTGAAGADPLERVPPLDGRLRVDAPALAGAADDFGHLVSHRPMAVLEPGSVRDVAVMTGHCRRHRIPVAARGRGHATNGQAQTAGGLVIDMGTLRDIRVREDSADVQAGARWSEVLRATLPRGLTPPVLTDYLELSVGGTLSAGGLGGASQRHGAQTDNVLELEVVTGDGERFVCSRGRRAALFHAVLAGLGQCAIIIRATVRLRPAPATVRRYRLGYPGVAALTADQRRVVRDGRFAYVEGQVEPAPDGAAGWRHVLEAVAFHRAGPPPDDTTLLGDLSHLRGTEEIDDLPYRDFLDRLAPGVADLESIGEWARPHPWFNMLLPGSATDAFVSDVLEDLTPADIGASGVILLYPIPRPRLGTPLLRVPEEPLVFLFALLKTASVGAADPATMVRANRELYERLRKAGGHRYPVGSVPVSHAEWREHYGSAWPRFAAAKRRHDPMGILAPGQGVFP